MNVYRPLYLPPAYQDAPDHGRLILRDGSSASIRPARAEDYPHVQEFFARLSPQSRRMRFFSENKPDAEVIRTFCDIANPRQETTLLVWRTADGKPRVVAVGSYIAHDDTTAEFAVAVDDTFHGKGLGGLLLERLSVLAASHGFVRFNAFTHINNRAMLDTFRASGFHIREQYEDGIAEVTLSLAPGAESEQHASQRDRLFTQASIRPFFRPTSVAVIGASRDPEHPGHRLFMTLLRNQFRGVVYPVNPQATQVSGVKAYPTARDLPEPVDLAVIAVAYDQIPGIIDDCAAGGIRAVIIVSQGFADSGAEGRQRQEALLEQVRGYGMRLLGPHSLGVINNHADCQLNASLCREPPETGTIALSSQSGALGIALLNVARKRRLGLSMFVSMGNKADVTGNDLLYYWEDDPSVDVILLYLESFGNPRRFGRIARDVSRRKPILCVKSRRRPGSHEEAAVEALFRQTGVIRTGTLEDMFDTAALLGAQPLPRGPRVAVLSNSHGAGVLCEDACAADGLIVTARDFFGETPESTSATLQQLLRRDDVDAIIVIDLPIPPADGASGAAALGTLPDLPPVQKPLLLVSTNVEASSSVKTIGTRSIPCYLFPETAVHALAAAHRYRAWREGPVGIIPACEDINRNTIRTGLASTEGINAKKILAAAGVNVADVPPTDGIAIEIELEQNPVFGPVLSFSLGGYHRSTLKDVAFRMAPLTDVEAADMIRSVRGYALLEAAGSDLAALEDLLLRISLLAEEFPEIDRLRITRAQALPGGQGVVVTQADITRTQSK
ncbi:MAG TPA: GNAT family N-acetyltransferase [Kiritimatiellia bacterium]|nr:GNAT family N-acetyltransferase [Kiritimatiellia bacterium]HMO99522.1 GNAT family N-acetyltransferase [Kiritimatiellia bacterium]HMP97165.1 GNAT family N-acetyltransferase [Kiritimatiellia bacterium]